MTDLMKGEEVYAKGLQRILSDPKVRQDLEQDPTRTLEDLGFVLDDDARRELAQGPSAPELGVAAAPAVLVRVATNGTRPAVSVVVRSSTLSATRGRAQDLEE